MKWMTWTGQQLVPIGGVPSGPGPDPEDPKLPPPAVISLAATSPSPTQLVVSWLAPSDPNAGGFITHYQIDLDGEDYDYSHTSTSITFNDLEPDSEHTITVRAVNNSGLVGPGVSVSAWTQVEPPPYDADLGTIGDRPALTVRPDETNTGPRQSVTQTWSTSQAINWLNSSASLESDGWRYIRRTRIQGTLRLAHLEQRRVIFEDCIIEGGLYAIEGYGIEDLPGTELPEFRFCEITGGSSSCVRDGGLRLLRCNLHRGVDIIKTNGAGSEYYACYMHDTRHDDGAHCDVIQIRSRSEGLLIHWNNLVGVNALESQSAGGQTANAVLQTGKVSSNIGPVTWRNNWVDGGHYTIRVGNATDLDGYSRQYVFRDNRWGRNNRYGPVYSGVQTGLDWDNSNVWDDTGEPVLG